MSKPNDELNKNTQNEEVSVFIKDGWTFNLRARNLDLFTIPSEDIATCEDFQVQLVHIASSPGLTRQVYFVDKRDRNAWVTVAQCKTREEALEVYYSYRFAKHNGDV